MEFLLEKSRSYKAVAKELHRKYQDYLPAFFFGAGFLFDIFTLGEVDDFSNIITLTLYLLFSFLILAIEYLEISHERFNNKWIIRFINYRDDIFHFLCGSLLSAFTLFYFKSGSLENSFIFMGVMMGVLLLNEIEAFQKKGIIIRSSMLMLCLISYTIYIIPVLLGKTNSFLFYICLTIALIISTICFFILTHLNKDRDKNLKTLLIPHLLVGVIFLGLYGLKVVPPIPLSLKYIGVFHNVKKVNGTYQTIDQNPKWKFWNNGDQAFYARPGDKVYMFTKIFAPGGFAGKVYIRWLRNTKDGLKTSDKIPLKITGGRDDGFRGYAFKSNFVPGDWQIRVESEDGLEIGRINLEIIKDQSQKKRKFNIVNR